MLDRQVTLTTSTLLNLIRRRGAQPHSVLARTRVWEGSGARRRADEKANAELRRYGLLGRGGVDSGLIATIDAVARPSIEYYAWIDGGYDGKALSYTLLAGGAGAEGFVLARNTKHEGIVLVSLRPDELIDNFLAQIPRLRPGRGHRMLVPKSALTGGRPGAHEDFAVLRGGTPSQANQEADELRRLLALPRLGGGSLYVAARGASGRRERVDRPVNYIDTNEGRWLTEEIPGSGEPAIAFTPGTTQVIVDRLRNALGRLPLS
ncbi:ESX secretion-associated protein EspG [Saccharomonospora sp. NPDC006951]